MSLKTLNSRIMYAGGNQLSRINKQKLQSLRAAFKNDYNSMMIKLSDSTLWPCLINTKSLTEDYDKKVLSIEFESNLEPGDTFYCENTKTNWMVYLPHLTETAYMRAEIIRCRHRIYINSTYYWVYLKGPTETTITWNHKEGIYRNEGNESFVMMIKNDTNTIDYFHKLDKIKIDSYTYEIESVDKISIPGIIKMNLKESYTNVAEELPEVVLSSTLGEEEQDIEMMPILGKIEVTPNTIVGYEIRSDIVSPNGTWTIRGNRNVKILDVMNNGKVCKVEIGEKARTTFEIVYDNYYSLQVTIINGESCIVGPDKIYPYDIAEYRIYRHDGQFYIDSDLAQIQEQKPGYCKVIVTTGKKGDFVLYYETDGTNERFELPITILSL